MAVEFASTSFTSHAKLNDVGLDGEFSSQALFVGEV